jgi:hypothetical protein
MLSTEFRIRLDLPREAQLLQSARYSAVQSVVCIAEEPFAVNNRNRFGKHSRMSGRGVELAVHSRRLDWETVSLRDR